MLLGKIIHSNDHLEYLCQIYRADEIEPPPEPGDFAIGQFVSIDLPEGSSMIGLIFNTQLFNPDFGRLGPRLSPESDLEIFSPDFLEERAVLISIVAVGTSHPDGIVSQTPPTLTPDPDARVHRLGVDEIRNFHVHNDRLHLGYIPLLIRRRASTTQELLLLVIDQLGILFPAQERLLALLRDDLLWQARVAPLGGDA